MDASSVSGVTQDQCSTSNLMFVDILCIDFKQLRENDCYIAVCMHWQKQQKGLTNHDSIGSASSSSMLVEGSTVRLSSYSCRQAGAVASCRVGMASEMHHLSTSYTAQGC